MNKTMMRELKKWDLRKTKKNIKTKTREDIKMKIKLNLNRIFKIDKHNNENETGLFKIRMQYGVPAYANTLVKDASGNKGVIIGSKEFNFGYMITVYFIDDGIMFMGPTQLDYIRYLGIEHVENKTLIEMFHEF